MKKLLFALLALLMLTLSGCHGARERLSVEIPSELDTGRQFEITFWAKNDTNVTQADI